MNNIVRENLGRIINDKKITQKELSQKLNLSRTTINKHLSHSQDSNPTIDNLFKYAEALDIDFPQVFSAEPNVELLFDQNMTLEKYMNIYVQNLKYKLRGKSQSSLSYEEGIRESTISELLNRKNNNPKLNTLTVISEQLDTRLELMFSRGGDIL